MGNEKCVWQVHQLMYACQSEGIKVLQIVQGVFSWAVPYGAARSL